MNLSESRKRLGLGRKRSFDAVLEAFSARTVETGRLLAKGTDPDRHRSLRTWGELVEALEVAAAGATTSSSVHAAKAPEGRGEPDPKHDSTASGGGHDTPVPWPTPPSESEVKAALGRWAQTRRDVPDDFFDRTLEITDASVGSYTMQRVFETRSEEVRTVGGSAPPEFSYTYSGSLSAIDTPRPTAAVDKQWDLLKDGSVSTARCGHCNQGRATCGRCSGSGRLTCDRRERCPVCRGSGEVHEESSDYSSKMISCPECHRRGDVRCTRCNGTGHVECGTCSGMGTVPCTTCDATGWLTTYTHGLVQQKVRAQPVGGVNGTAEFTKVAKHASAHHYVRSGQDVPPGLPDGEAARVRGVLSHEKGELFRQLDLEILPVTSIHYDNSGKQERAFLVGTEGEVFAPEIAARHRRHILYVVGACLALVAAVVGLLFALGVLPPKQSDADPTPRTQSDGQTATISGARIARQFRETATAAPGSGSRPETTTCPSGLYADGDLVSCSFELEDGRSVELLITLERQGEEWTLNADVGSIE